MDTPSLAALAPRWHLLVSGAADGVENMAIDVALMALARRTGAATLRIYTWDRPTLSLGRHERARGLFDPAALDSAGVGVVRRPTGGRALLHHREVTYSVTAPDALPLAASYAAINRLLLDALARLGVAAAPAARAGRPLRPEGSACFAEPAAGELVVGDAKLVGSAQLREEGALLQHGSILLADDQPMIATLRTDAAPAAAPTAPAATLEATLGRPVAAEEVIRALTSALQAALGAADPTAAPTSALAPTPLDPALLRHDLARLVIAFADPEWTWRR